jgi:hypothetical protein
LSHFLLLLLHQDRFVMRAKSGHAHLHAIKFLYLDKFLAPRQFVPRHCASVRHQLCNRGQIRGSDQTCTATHVMLNKICTWTAKSAPYPPCTVTALWLKYQDPARCCRRVTQPPFIAVPLAKIQVWHLDIRLPALQVI